MTHSQRSRTTAQPVPAPWVGHPNREGRRSIVPVDVAPGGTGEASPSIEAQVALWRYEPAHAEAEAEAEAHRDGNLSAPRRPRLLMIHGFRGDHHGLQLIVDALPEFEVLVPDLPGFGQTPPARSRPAGGKTEHTVELYAGLIDALAETLGLDAEDLLVGHSFGSTVVAAHAAGSNRQWAGLVLSAPISAAIFSWPTVLGAAAVEVLYRACQRLPERSGNAVLRSAAVQSLMNLTMTVDRDPLVTAYVRDQHRRYFGEYSDRRTLLEAYRASSRHTAADYAAQLDLPVLLLPGARDQLSSPASRRRLLRALPRGTMDVIRGAGHLLHYEKPAQVARAIRRFAARL